MRTVAIALSALFMQSYPPRVPRDGARRLLESDRVIVWELQWPKGKPTSLHRHDLEHVSIGIEQGTFENDRAGAMIEPTRLNRNRWAACATGY